jgi:hypothetical protein
MHSAFSKAEAQLSFFFAMENLKNAMLSRSIASDRAELQRLEGIRKMIISSYSVSESDYYAWRPHVEGDWIGLKLVHLPNGRATYSPYSPLIKDPSESNHNEATLWNLVDTETGIVYHHALRSAEERYQSGWYAEGQKRSLMNYGIRLVAEKVKLK